MTQIISIMGRKGGTTKTTVAINLAAACARAGLKTVLVDSDGQGNASSSVRVTPHDAFYKLIAEDQEFVDVLVPVPIEFHGQGELYLLAASNLMRVLESDPATSALIYERFNELRDWADVVIVDTSPGITHVHAGFYYTSDHIVLPTLCEYTSITSLTSMFDYLQSAQVQGEQAGYASAKVLGIIPNRFSASEKVQQVNIGFIRGRYGEQCEVFPMIRNLTVWNQASQLRESIFVYAPTDDYNARRQARAAAGEMQPLVDRVLRLCAEAVA